MGCFCFESRKKKENKNPIGGSTAKTPQEEEVSLHLQQASMVAQKMVAWLLRRPTVDLIWQL